MSDDGYSMNEDELREEILGPLDLSWEETGTPSNEIGDWYQTLARFTRRGFVRALGQLRGSGLALYVEVALPGFAPEEVVDALRARLPDAEQWSFTTGGEVPVVAHAEVSSEDDERLREVLSTLARVGEGLQSLEDGASLDEALGAPRSGAGASSGAAPERERGEDRDEARGSAGNGGSAGSGGAFETIGADAPPERDGGGRGEQRRDSERGQDERESARSSGGGAFEPIGGSEAADEASAGGADETDFPRISSYEADVGHRGVHADLHFESPVESRTYTLVKQGLSRSLRNRFDVAVDFSRDSERSTADRRLVHVDMELLPDAILDSHEKLHEDVVRYFDRLVEFTRSGMSLLDVLGISDARAQGRSSRRDASRSDDARGRRSRRDEGERTGGRREGRERRREGRERRREGRERDVRGAPQRRRERPSLEGPSLEDQGGDDGVVLDLGGGGASAGEEVAAGAPLEAGNYTDPRLDREDATTPLVDIVLRHPGYSDQRISQVLSILLDVEYSEASRLAEAAPCVLAWGIGRERAQTFKNVIEGAGGRVVLVEPEAFPQD